MILQNPSYLPSKDITGIVPVAWVMSNTALLIIAIDISVTVTAGIDANPSAILSGAATGEGTNTALQIITGGVSGCTYRIKATITLSDGTKPVGVAFITVNS
jgi:hypothetical protein